MLHRIPKPTSLGWSSGPLLGFKAPNSLKGGGSHVGCLPVASVGTTEPARATFSDIKGKIAFQNWLNTGVGVEDPKTPPVTPRPPPSTPTVPSLIRRTHVGTQVGTHLAEPSDTSEPRLVKGKP
jgi:hypothetical protein